MSHLTAAQSAIIAELDALRADAAVVIAGLGLRYGAEPSAKDLIEVGLRHAGIPVEDAATSLMAEIMAQFDTDLPGVSARIRGAAAAAAITDAQRAYQKWDAKFHAPASTAALDAYAAEVTERLRAKYAARNN